MAAIYMWFVDVGVIFTTPLYPVEAIEEISWSADITGVDSLGVAFDSQTGSSFATSGEIELVKIYGGAGADSMTGSSFAVSGEIELVFIAASGGFDSQTGSSYATSGEILAAKVTHVQPSEDEVHWFADITNVTRP